MTAQTKRNPADAGVLFVWLFLFHHHLAGFIDIAAAEGDDQIAGLGVLLDPVGGFLQAVHQHGAGDLRCQLCAGNGGVVGLAAAHDGGQHCDVRDLEHIHKVVEQHLGAAVCKRLVDGDQALVAHFFGGVQGGSAGNGGSADEKRCRRLSCNVR